MAEKPIAFTITPARVAFVLALLGLGTFGYNMVSWVNARETYEKVTDASIDTVKAGFATAIASAVQSNEKLTGQVDRLTGAVNDLLLAVRTLEVQQDRAAENK
jgi:hypothetical protein